MNELTEIKIKKSGDKLITTSLNVAHVFEKRHSDVLRDIENLSCSTEFRERNFALSYYTNDLSNAAGRKYNKYEITRDGFTFLVMGYTGEKAARFKEAYIEAFNAMENELSVANPPLLPDFNDPVAAARAWADAKESELKAKLELQESQPKIEYYDKVADAQGLHTISEAAKLLGTGRNKLFTWLRESGYLMQNNEPYQKYMTAGYFEIRETVHENIISIQTFLTAKGLQKIAKKHGVRKEKAGEPQLTF